MSPQMVIVRRLELAVVSVGLVLKEKADDEEDTEEGNEKTAESINPSFDRN